MACLEQFWTADCDSNQAGLTVTGFVWQIHGLEFSQMWERQIKGWISEFANLFSIQNSIQFDFKISILIRKVDLECPDPVIIYKCMVCTLYSAEIIYIVHFWAVFQLSS